MRDAAVGPAKGGKRLHQPPRGVGEQLSAPEWASKASVRQTARGRPCRGRRRGAPAALQVDPAALDQGAVDPRIPGRWSTERVEVLAAVLLLALDEEADPAGERADRRE